MKNSTDVNKTTQNLRISIVYSLPTKRARAGSYNVTEEDTADSAEQIEHALKARGASVSLIPIDEHSIDVLTTLSCDLIFNLIEWTGLDFPLSDKAFSLLEKLNIPFTGASRANYLLTACKNRLKKEFVRFGIPTPVWQYFSSGDEPISDTIPYPVIVKPTLEHCSIGLTCDAIINNPGQLSKAVKKQIGEFHQPVIAERYIEGREFHVTVLSTPIELNVLPPSEIVFLANAHHAFLTFQSRWDESHRDYDDSRVEVADIPNRLREQIEDISRTTFFSLKYRDYTRLDMRYSGDLLYVLEANSNPGLSDETGNPMTVSYKAAGMTFEDVVWTIVQSALYRFSSKHT